MSLGRILFSAVPFPDWGNKMNNLLKVIKKYVEMHNIKKPFTAEDLFINSTKVVNAVYTIDTRTPAERALDEAKEEVKRAERGIEREKVTIELLEAIQEAEKELK